MKEHWTTMDRKDMTEREKELYDEYAAQRDADQIFRMEIIREKIAKGEKWD